MVKMTEEEDELKTEVRGGVGCILLNRHFDQILITHNLTFLIFTARPKKLNCLSLAMIRKMTKTVKEWNQKNSGVQVVVVRGAGETSEPVLVDGEDIVRGAGENFCQGDGYW